MFQRISKPHQDKISKPHQDSGETPRWLPLPADPTPGAEKDSEVTRKVYLTPAFVDQTPKNKKPGDKDLVHQKKEEHNGILKRRQGFHQVDIEEIRCHSGVQVQQNFVIQYIIFGGCVNFQRSIHEARWS